jgi:hypothetical protein
MLLMKIDLSRISIVQRLMRTLIIIKIQIASQYLSRLFRRAIFLYADALIFAAKIPIINWLISELMAILPFH